MKIFVISDVTMPGGVDTYICQMLAMTIRKNYKVRVLISDVSGTDSLYKKLIRFKQIECIRGSISRNNSEDVIISSVEPQIQEFRPDIVHVVCGAVHSALAIREYLSRKKLVFLFTESLINEKYKFDCNIYARVRSVYEKASKVITVSKNNAAIISTQFQLPSDNIITICNGVEVDKVKKRTHLPSMIFRFVTVARLCEQKGIDILIRAVYKLSLMGITNFKVDIWGEGECYEEYQKMINQYGLYGYISLRGWSDNVSDILCEYDSFVLPSRYEGMPIALLEAMAAKIPCIATSVSGIPDVLDEGRVGMLVKPENVGELSRAMLLVMENYDYFHMLSEKAYDHVCMKHDSAQNMDKVSDVWNEIIVNQG